ncbi:MAG: signal peptidase I, partial [Armatimonadetes bacterium]|nr:signal peptidase I [Armatimonadota bacterium]
MIHDLLVALMGLVRKLFTEYSTQVVIGLVGVLVLMRVVLEFAPGRSAWARLVMWFWHPAVRADWGGPLPEDPARGVRRPSKPVPAASTLDYDEIRSLTLQNMNSTLVALALVFFVIRPYVIQAFYIPSSSMEPTLMGSGSGRQDRVLVNKYLFYFRPPRTGDIVVFHAPPAAMQQPGQPRQDYIKRVIGTPGDIVEVKEHRAYVNGLKLDEPYLGDLPPGPFPGSSDPVGNPAYYGPVQVPPRCYLMMGDNRTNSHDSRRWGHWDDSGMERRFVHKPFVKREDILGKAMCVFWPILEFDRHPFRIHLV